MPLPMLQQREANTSDLEFLVQYEDEEGHSTSVIGREQVTGREEVQQSNDDAATNAGFVIQFPANLRKSLEVLKEIAHYGDNWDSYGSPPIREGVCDSARELLLSLGPEVPSPTVVPVSGGGIQFEWQFEERELEIEFCPNGGIEYLQESEEGITNEGRISPVHHHLAPNLVRWLLTNGHADAIS